MPRPPIAPVLLALLAVAGIAVPAMTISTSGAPGSSSDPGAADTVTVRTAATAQNDSRVNVTVGQQLSTVIGVSSDDVQTGFENTAFEFSVARGSEEAQAAAIADRAAELRAREEAIRADYQAATAAYEAGELTRSEYAQRIATLNARATNLRDSYDQLQRRAANVSTLELRAAGVNRSTLEPAVANLSGVTGTGAAALLTQYTGESRGDVEIETDNGLSIEVTNDYGERTREFERPRDENDTLSVSQTTALATAREALSATETGTWVLTDSTVRPDDGSYEFAFGLRNAATLTGDAEIVVDGSSGAIVGLQEELETRDDEAEANEGEDDERDDDRELAIVVEDTPAPNATITVKVLADGTPARNVTVALNDQPVGTTDADGLVEVTLPPAGDAELTAQTDDADAGIEFEFEERADEDEQDDEDEVLQKLNVAAALDADTVTATVSYDGNPVENVSVYANDRAVGTTDAAGTVTFTIDPTTTEELDLEFVKGAFDAEWAYVIQNGTLTLTDAPNDDTETDEAEDDDTETEVEDDDEETEDEEDSDSGSESTDDDAEVDTDDDDGHDEDG